MIRLNNNKPLYVSLESKPLRKSDLIMDGTNQAMLIPIRPVPQWFTCPLCKGHKWGTVSNIYINDPRFNRAHNLGECHSDRETGITCNHVWDRKDDVLYFSDKPEGLIT